MLGTKEVLLTMSRILFTIIFLVHYPAFAQNIGLPDGTLIMSNKPGTIVGNIAKRSVNGARGILLRALTIGRSDL